MRTCGFAAAHALRRFVDAATAALPDWDLGAHDGTRPRGTVDLHSDCFAVAAGEYIGAPADAVIDGGLARLTTHAGQSIHLVEAVPADVTDLQQEARRHLTDLRDELTSLLAFDDEPTQSTVEVHVWFAVADDGLWVNAVADVVSATLTEGRFARAFRFDPDADEVTVRHTGASVDPPGSGFGGRYTRTLLDRYADVGVDEVEVSAGAAGRYAWATLGFEPKDPAGYVAQIRHGLARRDVDLTDPHGLHQVLDDVADGRAPLRALADFGRDRPDGDGVHDGRKALLAGGSWEGVWYPAPVTAAR